MADPNAAQAGIAALQRGDAATARALLRTAVSGMPVGQRPWLALAQACERLADGDGERAALDGLLRDEPRNIVGLVLMGFHKERQGDDRGAQSSYTTALRQAAETPPPRDLHGHLLHAQRFVEAAQTRFADHLLAAIPPSVQEKGRISRFDRALDLLLGRRELYLSQPSMFYFPGLPQQPFFDSADFAWVAELEAETDAIRAEMLALTAEFAPYIAGDPDRPRPAGNPLLDDPSWGAFHLWRGGAPTDESRLCPRTMAALARIPMPRIEGRSPAAFFSRLKPGAHIRPHHGLLNTRLICHLPLVVPPGCAMRVGDETREWREGALTMFDDSIEHEAWNRGTDTRTVLIFEVWRPELDADERSQLTNVFEAIQRYGGAPVDEG